jgi:tRNA(Phe) wybutosine-synthesizing methylase Tyw3
VRGSRLVSPMTITAAVVTTGDSACSHRLTVTREPGYHDSLDYFRHLVAQHRPRRPAETMAQLQLAQHHKTQVGPCLEVAAV